MVVKILKKGNSITEEKLIPQVSKTFTFIKKKKITPREKRAVANFAILGKKGEALRRAGFPESVARNPQQVFDKPEVDDEVKTILEELEDERKEVLARMKITRQKAGYAVLSMTLGALNRDIELLSGRPTDRRAYELPEEEKTRLRKLFEKNKKK